MIYGIIDYILLGGFALTLIVAPIWSKKAQERKAEKRRKKKINDNFRKIKRAMGEKAVKEREEVQLAYYDLRGGAYDFKADD